MDAPLTIGKFCNHRSHYYDMCNKQTGHYVRCLTDDGLIFRVTACEEYRDVIKPHYFELRNEAVAILVTGKLT